jgi:LysM repeat protein
MNISPNSAQLTPPAMKILKIFGVVVAVHAIAFIVIFANPGCRSTAATNPEPVIAAASAPNTAGDEYVPVTPVSMDTDSGTPMVGVNSQSDGRYTPTRPGAATDATAEIIPASTHTVQRGDSLWTIARKNGLTTAELASANNISANATLQIGQKLLVPSKDIASTEDAGTPTGGGTNGYIVKSGDTLSAIAKRHGTTIAAIRSANNLRNDIVRVGQELQIPDGSSSPAPKSQTAAISTPPTASGPATHVVKMGDTLGAIARRYKVSVADIARANNITDPTRIGVGQELTIPGAGTAASSPSAPAVSTIQSQPEIKTPLETVPSTTTDLDSALPPDFIDAPVIEVEDPRAPQIE